MVFLGLLNWGGSATAQAPEPLAVEDVPGPLQPWIGWALDGGEPGCCPWISGAPECVWPGRLALAIEGRGGTFSLDVIVDRDTYLALPGGSGFFPNDVEVYGQTAALTLRGEAPHVRLEAGRHRVTGGFSASRLPELLPVPASVGLIDLRINGERSAVRRDDLRADHSTQPRPATLATSSPFPTFNSQA